MRYNGSLASEMSEIIVEIHNGASIAEVAAKRGVDPGTVRHALEREAIVLNEMPWSIYGIARYEHAWLLRAEGAPLGEIAFHLGVSQERVRQMIIAFGKRVQKAFARGGLERASERYRTISAINVRGQQIAKIFDRANPNG